MTKSDKSVPSSGICAAVTIAVHYSEGLLFRSVVITKQKEGLLFQRVVIP